MDGSNIKAGYGVASDELRSFVDRIEQLRAEQADLKALEKEVFAELKGRGYMTRPFRTILILRKRKPDDVAEEAAILEMYKTALGMT